jgi:crotonobetaine/carnitine-CoA ligase
MSCETIREVLRDAVRRDPDGPYLWFDGHTTSLRELDTSANRVARGLLELGLGAGDRVAIMLGNRPEFLSVWFGAVKIGVSIVPINTASVGREAAYSTSHSDASLLVLGDAYLPCLESVLAARPDLPVVVVGDAPHRHRGLDDLMSGDATEPPPSPLDGDSEAAILYTSGTTGAPKGCVMGQSYYLANGRRYVTHMELTPADRVITPLPLFHMNPQITSTMGSLMAGCGLALVDRFHPRTWWDTVRASQSTVFNYLGVMPAMLMGLPERADDADQPAGRGWGAGVPSALQAAFEARFSTRLVEVYGMTESGLNLAEPLGDDRRVGNHVLGFPFPGFEARVVDEAGNDCPADVPGELLLRSDDPTDRRRAFMRGYYKDPEATEHAWRGGWFHTGDFVARDEDGRGRFVDRKKDIVRRSGENIAAAEVEEVLRLHPQVIDVAVVAVPDPVREQEGAAVVVVGERDAGPPPDELWAWCDERLAYFKVPRYIAFVEQLPRTSTQKVAKRVLLDDIGDGALAVHDRTERRARR